VTDGWTDRRLFSFIYIDFDYQFKLTSVLSGHCTLSTDEILGLGLLWQVDEVTFKGRLQWKNDLA